MFNIIHISNRDVTGMKRSIIWVNGKAIDKVFKSQEAVNDYLKSIKRKIYVSTFFLIIYQMITNK